MWLQQGRFRDALRKRDNACAITGLEKQFESEKPYRVLSSAHIFPASRLSDWERGNYQRFIEDTSPASVIGESKLFSPQNGLLLRYDIHLEFDDFVIGVDPDVSYFMGARSVQDSFLKCANSRRTTTKSSISRPINMG